jgi:hypothetical protein
MIRKSIGKWINLKMLSIFRLNVWCSVGRFSKPRILPQEATCFVTSAVRGAVTAKIVEEYNIANAPHLTLDFLARSLQSFGNRESSPTELKHLRHEGKTLSGASIVECVENVRPRKNLYHVASAETLADLYLTKGWPLTGAVNGYLSARAPIQAGQHIVSPQIGSSGGRHRGQCLRLSSRVFQSELA